MSIREYDDHLEAQEPAEAPSSRREIGERGEALAADFLVRVKDHELLTQHTPGDKPQGIDAETLRPDGTVQFSEAKATDGHSNRPRMAATADGPQMSDTWLQPRAGDSSQVGFDGPAEGQVAKQAIHIDFGGDTLTVWDIDPQGRPESSPSEIYRASDLEDD